MRDFVFVEIVVDVIVVAGLSIGFLFTSANYSMLYILAIDFE